jgi:hypothetical protein
MSSDQILEYITRKPFRPFTINLLDGEQIRIDNVHALMNSPRRPELLIVFTEDGKMHLFETSVICSIYE